MRFSRYGKAMDVTFISKGRASRVLTEIAETDDEIEGIRTIDA